MRSISAALGEGARATLTFGVTLPNVVVTPHLGATTQEAQDRAGVIVEEQVAAALSGDFVSNAVNIPFVNQLLDEDRRFKSTELVDASATIMLDELLKWTDSLVGLRGK